MDKEVAPCNYFLKQVREPDNDYGYMIKLATP